MVAKVVRMVFLKNRNDLCVVWCTMSEKSDTVSSLYFW
jgi:hypothetical protein